MRWLDAVIDLGYAASIRSRLDVIGPYSRIGSVANVVLCAAIAAIIVWVVRDGSPAGYGYLVFVGLVQVPLVRICVRAFRGDFDGVVPDEDDEDA